MRARMSHSHPARRPQRASPSIFCPVSVATTVLAAVTLVVAVALTVFGSSDKKSNGGTADPSSKVGLQFGFIKNVRVLSTRLAELDPQLLILIKQHPAGPALLDEPGVGPVVTRNY